MPVRQLTEAVINRIAAGEVIERPASVMKELVDNAIDAGADRLEIITASGGKTLISVTDNGKGMTAEDLKLAVERHCTSKLNENDLTDIRTLGFRGEALPSIGAVARLAISTRNSSESNGWKLVIEGGKKGTITPTALNQGTRVEVKDLFFSTPARLKFLKSDRAEANAITDIIKRIALAYPNIQFSLTGSDRQTLEYGLCSGENAWRDRISQVMGADFIENSVEISAERENVSLVGFASLPTYHRSNSLMQFFFVNGRPIKDKQLLGALKGAYADVLARDKYPLAVLNIKLPPQEVDVNVHPAKTEVRFRDANLVKGLLVGSIRQVLTEQGHRASSAVTWGNYVNRGESKAAPVSQNWIERPMANGTNDSNHTTFNSVGSTGQSVMDEVDIPSGDNRAHEQPVDEENIARPLGAPRAQIHENYIISQTNDGMIIVDQHAAHERLVYERMKEERAANGIQRQMRLVPDIIELPEEDVNRLTERTEELESVGLVLEAFGPGAIIVRETPAMLKNLDVKGLIKDLADDLAEWDSATRLEEKLNFVAATMACYGSIRSGRRLRTEEMNALLREMEATPLSGQCNHGRPTYVELKLKDIERLFGRR